MNANVMSELDSGAWNCLNPSTCLCNGSGWLLSDFDTWHKCQTHNQGQPYPEDDESDFDYEAASLENYRAAYRAFCEDSGIWMRDFNKMVRARLSGDNSPANWVNVAERLASEIVTERLEERARAAGYSCRLEAAWAAEAAVEADARHRGMDPDVYATFGSPERADADSWYPRGY